MRLLKDGFGYLEAPRWRNGFLWFSDLKSKLVYRMNDDGEIEETWQIPKTPSGLGFASDNSLLVVSMDDSQLLRISGNEMTMFADLASISIHPNDMAVDASGRAYISQFGYDLFGGAAPTSCGVIVVEPNGHCRIEGEGLIFPNGLAFTQDGRTLIVAESFGYRLSAFDVSDDGKLGPRRDFKVFNDPDKDVLDGLCLDIEGGVWVACPFAGEFRRVLDGGQVADRIAPETGGKYCVACTLGGHDMKTLFLLIADTDVDRLANNWDSTARIETLRVDVPGFSSVKPLKRTG